MLCLAYSKQVNLADRMWTLASIVELTLTLTQRTLPDPNLTT